MKPNNSDPLLSLSDEELIAQGYLIVRAHGNTTHYVPTEKYRAARRMPTASQALIVRSQLGTINFDTEEVYHLCGECGENLYPSCGCNRYSTAMVARRLTPGGCYNFVADTRGRLLLPPKSR